MTELSRPYQDELIKALRDPSEAAEYLNAALESGSDELFLTALRNVADAQGIIPGGNSLQTMIRISGSMGLRFSAQGVAA